MPFFNDTKSFSTGLKDVLSREISDSFSITRDGLHIEIVKSYNSYQFKIFDLMSTELLQEGEIEKVLVPGS